MSFGFMYNDEQPDIPNQVRLHVRKVAVDTWDNSSVWVVTSPDEVTARVAFGAAWMFTSVVPTNIDRRGWRPVVVRWVHVA